MDNIEEIERIYSNRLREGLATEPRYKWFVERFPKAPADILEVGCNSGKAAEWMASLGYNVTAIDLQGIIDKMPKDTPVDYQPISIRKFDESLVDKFQVVVMGEVVQHITNPDDAIINVVNYLADDGDFLMSTIKHGNTANSATPNYFPEETIVPYLEQFGLEYVNLEHWRNHIWVHMRGV